MKKIIIIGATSGIGRGLAEVYSQEDYLIGITGRRENLLEESQVEATKEMLDTATRQTASNLVGKTVIMTTDLNKDGYIAGKVDYWEVISNKIYLGIDGKLYDIDDLDTVMDDDYYKKWNKNDSTTDTSNKSDSSSSDTSSDKSDTTGKTE